MNQDDADSRGKAWFKPGRATAVVITAMHTTDVEERRVKAYIYLGEDNHSDYNIRRGHHYTFNIIVRGVDDIKVDTNVDSSVGYFLIDYGSNLTMDAHPDFRPMRMHAANGTAVVEILDSQERTCNEPGFDADWLKISPLNLMYHQVKQSSPGDAWQQAANPESKFVRPKYIPHKSIRTKLEAEGKNGWPAVPSNLDDDDSLPFADATYRMCYRITDIPFADASVIDRTFYVYADEFLQNSGNRTARVRFSFYKNGGDPDKPEIRIFIINQSGYLSFYTDDNHKGAGLNLLNEDGTPSSVKRKMAVEDAEVRSLVERLELGGMKVVSDGGFRSRDFLESWEGICSKDGRPFSEGSPLEITGRLSLLRHPILEEFAFLDSIVDGGVMKKQHIPSPAEVMTQIIQRVERTQIETVYSDIRLLTDDIASCYKFLLTKLYDAGCRYVQFDGVRNG